MCSINMESLITVLVMPLQTMKYHTEVMYIIRLVQLSFLPLSLLELSAVEIFDALHDTIPHARVSRRHGVWFGDLGDQIVAAC